MSGPARRRVRLAWLVAAALFAVAAFAIALASGSLPGNNLHEVVPGEIYRSAQPGPEDLRGLVERHGIATVLAVRPAQEKKAWYRDEQRAVAELDLDHHSVKLHPNKMPSRALLAELVARIDAAERPVLLHCRAGVERTGLAATVALLLEGVPPEIAREQFGLRYGYVDGFATTDLPRVIDGYQRWLESNGAAHTPDVFRAWVNDGYVASFYKADIALTSLPAELRAGTRIPLELRVTNASEEPIVFSSEKFGVHVGTRVESLDPERPYARAGRGGYVDSIVEPGAALDVRLHLHAVPHAGRYRVVVDLVDEGVEWFADMGSPELVLELSVLPAPEEAQTRDSG